MSWKNLYGSLYYAPLQLISLKTLLGPRYVAFCKEDGLGRTTDRREQLKMVGAALGRPQGSER
jgi:hypothetical protein